MITYKWIGEGKNMVKAYDHKKDMPQLGINEDPVHVDFGLAGRAFVITKGGPLGKELLMKDGGWCTVLMPLLRESGAVMGIRDMTTADRIGGKLAEEWRGSMAAKVRETLNLRKVHP